ncbi:esterase-like activity of phytase family protein [Govanella unica]|uniref:Esterase-like activity of phytase family protein n=1 Tax=Govanella unica TaxID=2975056 RepID=A0A9X3TVF1_9PROT|nr:esterase-like activity of phytase family protein [Govania unica]MDA5192553.1 esterase-like activity of phytase family protein [Govania unica]
MARLPKLTAALLLSVMVNSCSPANPYESLSNLTPERSLSAEPLRTTALPLHRDLSTVRSVGQLGYLGGLVLQSGDRRFGGLSSLLVSADGREFLAVSDRGFWVVATLDYRNGQLSGAHDLRISPILDPEGQPLITSKRWGSDAEALTEIPGGLIVAFEGQHRLWQYNATFGDVMEQKAAHPLPLPANIATAIAALPGNGGLESLTRLKDGRLFAIAEEGGPEAGITPAWILDGDRSLSLFYQTGNNFKPTDLATLPNGDLLVLERRFTLLQGVAARVKYIAATDLKPGATVRGRELAMLSYPYHVDNMEGIAVREGPAGEIFVYLVSDDNYHPLQNTLLMMFQLNEP